VGDGAQKMSLSQDTGAYFGQQRPTDFNNQALKLPPLPG
jgi:hypothetical protein